jgi:hypothetical protein
MSSHISLSMGLCHPFVWHVVSIVTCISRSVLWRHNETEDRNRSGPRRLKLTAPWLRVYEATFFSHRVCLCDVVTWRDVSSEYLGYQTNSMEQGPLEAGVAQSVYRFGYGLDDRSSIPERVNYWILSLRHGVPTGSGAQPPSYPMSNQGCYPRSKAAGAWSRLLTSV